MKKYILNIILFLFTAAASFIYLSCDKFDTFPLNIPISAPVSVSGSGTFLQDDANFCLENDEDFQEYRDKMKQVTFVEAAWRTTYVSPGLQGNVNLTVRRGDNGNVLFTYDLPAIDPADYMAPNQPWIFQLNQNEVQLMNAYLDQIFNQGTQNFCFQATATVNVTGGTPTYQLEGFVDVVFEAETEF
jgi:hypothetical protein